MIDIVNFQLYGYPVMMYTMIFVTTGAIAFATLNPDKLPSISSISLPGMPSASPPNMGAPNAMGPPGMPPAAPAPAAQPQGGRKHKRKTAQKRRSPKKSDSAARTKKHHPK